MSNHHTLSRRQAVRLGAVAGALPLVHLRTAGAAGKLSVAFWDHWVPGGNNVMQKQVDAWAEKNKVDVTADFITGNNNKLLLTGVAEAQARTGHDMMTFLNWDGFNVDQALAPVDDVMARLTQQYGPVTKTAEYLAKARGNWRLVPTSTGTQTKPPCARIGMMKRYGFDVQAMYPARPEETECARAWNYDAFLKAAQAAYKDGFPFALGIGGGTTNTDGIDQVGASFHAFGAPLIDAHGAITVRSDKVAATLEYWRKLLDALPDDVVSYDDASNNRALISGKSALIFNPPSAWAVAKRDAPRVAEDCWTFPAPVGPAGRFTPTLTFFWGIYSFSRNQAAAKELIEYLLQREQIEERANAVEGYDLPPFPSMADFTIWERVQPPPGTVYNYPIRPWHHAEPSLTSSEARPEIAVQIYQHAIHNNMLARMKHGQRASSRSWPGRRTSWKGLRCDIRCAHALSAGRDCAPIGKPVGSASLIKRDGGTAVPSGQDAPETMLAWRLRLIGGFLRRNTFMGAAPPRARRLTTRPASARGGFPARGLRRPGSSGGQHG